MNPDRTFLQSARYLSPEGDGGVPAPQPRRGSVQLTQAGGATADAQAMLDPANQSLADALRIMLLLVKGALAMLVVLYILSGLGRVEEGEKGVRLLFGKVEASDLEPGFQYSLPYPIGELVKVEQGNMPVELNKEFWFFVQEGTIDPSPEKMSPTPSLKPDQGGSGSVLTADGNIAHTQWKVVYQRSQVANYSKNILPRDEEKLVRYAARRAVVQACATVNISELLTQSAESSAVARRAKEVAQQTLDRVESGLTIQTLSIQGAIPPLALRSDFARVQSAAANAAKAVEQSQGEARNLLLETAGEAAEYLVYYMDVYEQAVATGDKAKMASTLATIDALMEGREVELETATVEIGGQKIQLAGGKRSGLSGGAVAQTLAEAQTYRTTVVSRAKSDLRRFEAKLEQYNANPLVMVRREWTDAVGTFMGRDSVQTMLLPLGVGTMRLGLNADPDIAREMDRALKLRLRDETEKRRYDALRSNEFKTQTGQNTVSAGG